MSTNKPTLHRRFLPALTRAEESEFLTLIHAMVDDWGKGRGATSNFTPDQRARLDYLTSLKDERTAKRLRLREEQRTRRDYYHLDSSTPGRRFDNGGGE